LLERQSGKKTKHDGKVRKRRREEEKKFFYAKGETAVEKIREVID
jgi:hypothetical protein